jgi:hypothetical protein
MHFHASKCGGIPTQAFRQCNHTVDSHDIIVTPQPHTPPCEGHWHQTAHTSLVPFTKVMFWWNKQHALTTYATERQYSLIGNLEEITKQMDQKSYASHTFPNTFLIRIYTGLIQFYWQWGKYNPAFCHRIKLKTFGMRIKNDNKPAHILWYCLGYSWQTTIVWCLPSCCLYMEPCSAQRNIRW